MYEYLGYNFKEYKKYHTLFFSRKIDLNKTEDAKNSNLSKVSTVWKYNRKTTSQYKHLNIYTCSHLSSSKA